MVFRSGRICLSLSALVIAAGSGPVLAQSTLRAGTEFQVNQYTTGAQRLPSAVQAPDGTYFITWESQYQDGDSFGIVARRFSATGAPLGPEFQVNQATYSDEKQPSATVDSAGRFTVAWTGQDVSGGGVFARQYSATGPLGPEFRVNTYTSGDQFLPRVSAGPNGLAIVWQSNGQDGGGSGVYGRLYTLAGAPLTGEFRLSTETAGNQVTPVVAALNSGRYAVAWALQPSSSISALYSRLFDASGAPLAAERQLQGSPIMDHLTIAPGPAGTFAVAWWGAFTEGGKDHLLSTDFGILVNYHDANGVPTTTTGPGGAGIGTVARWQGSLGGNFTGRYLVAYASVPGVLPCFTLPPWPGPFCTATQPEDGSGSGVFARGTGWPAAPPRVQVNTTTAGNQERPTVGADPYGNALVAWQSANQDGSDFGVFAQRFGGLYAVSVAVDPAGNGVLDPGVLEEVRPSWRNLNGAAQSLGGFAWGYSGPAGAAYTINDATGGYGVVANGATAACADCYAVTVTLPGARPAVHMDSYLGESLTPDTVGVHKPWTLHVGGSFGDVSTASPFYRFIETLLHNGVTSGCGGTSYCPSSVTNREQMAPFVLVARFGPAYSPPACTTPMFGDVPASSPFCRWIEDLARRGVVGGCGGGNYCPAAPVTRDQMAVFVLRTLDPALDPPACTTPMFADVPASSPYCRWIEELARRGVVTGCGGGNYCPAASVTREQMAVFLTATFVLRLY